MLRELLRIIRGDQPLSVVAANFSQMVGICLNQVERAGEACFGEPLSPEDRKRVYEWDLQVNQLEQGIRKKLIIHLSIPSNYVDAPYCLLLMSVVKDVERIGDYAKNLLEVSDLPAGATRRTRSGACGDPRASGGGATRTLRRFRRI